LIAPVVIVITAIVVGVVVVLAAGCRYLLQIWIIIYSYWSERQRFRHNFLRSPPEIIVNSSWMQKFICFHCCWAAEIV